MLLATLRLDAAPSAPVFMSVRCDGADCGRPLRLPELAALSPGQWRVLGIPLKCFAATGADTTRITAPFRSEEHTSEIQSLMRISYAVFCLNNTNPQPNDHINAINKKNSNEEQ